MCFTTFIVFILTKNSQLNLGRCWPTAACTRTYASKAKSLNSFSDKTKDIENVELFSITFMST
jgi:hypothetical protein